ncbi:OmpW family protein [Rhodobacteraceae bacterium]|nr:OmpW family protein [Paracoccaceae bacterium]
MRTPRFALILAAACTTCLSGSLAMAQDAGSFTLGLGVHGVMPKDDNGRLADTFDVSIGGNVQPTVTLEYFFRDNWGVELLAATPFTHKVNLNGAKMAEVKHLPPTVSIQYHFANDSQVTPFFGVGLNYTAVLDVDEKNGLEGSKLELDNSWGVALHAGVDYAINDRSAMRLDMRWIDIDLDAKLNGADIGTVEVDPLIIGAAYVIKF